MRSIQFSVDCAEWTRYYYEIEVENSLTPDEIKQAAIAAIKECSARNLGAKCVGDINDIEPEINWPEDL